MQMKNMSIILRNVEQIRQVTLIFNRISNIRTARRGISHDLQRENSDIKLINYKNYL